MLKMKIPRAAVAAVAIVLVLAALAAAGWNMRANDRVAHHSPEPPVSPAGAAGTPDSPDPAGAAAADEAVPGPGLGAVRTGAGRSLDAPIRAGELAAMVRTTLSAAVAPGLAGADGALLAPGTNPEDTVTRGELARTVVRALRLEEAAAALAPAESMFQDISPLHRAFPAVALLHRLGLTAEPAGGFFRAEQAATVGETRQLLDAAGSLELRSGRVSQLNEPASSITIAGDDGTTTAYVLTPETLVVRNGTVAAAGQLRSDDTVLAVGDATGRLVVITAGGEDLTPAEQALETVASVVAELLTPEQTAAILAQDWEKAGTELKASLYNRLLEHGLTPGEAAALLSQDWPALTEHGKARITELAAARWSVPPEMVRAVLDQDWDTALGHAEVKVLEYLINELLEAANA